MSQYVDPNASFSKSTVPEHDVTMKGRRLLDITGVKQVESFDNEEFLLETVHGVSFDSWPKFANEELRCR